MVLTSCKNYHRNKAHLEVPVSSIEAGEALAIKYCQSCHLLPDPGMLDTKSWERGVLPNMGPRLGIFYYGFEKYPSHRNDRSLDSNFYPEKQTLSFSEWQNIIDYYVATSPDTLPPQRRKQDIKKELPLFKAITPSIRYESPSTSYIYINEKDSKRSLLVCDAIRQDIFFFNRNLQVSDSIHSTNGPIVDIDFREGVACNIGFMNPNNGRSGKAQVLSFINNRTVLQPQPLFDSLQRPVGISSSDLDKDGKIDYVVSEFGFLTGSLSWMKNMGNGNYVKNVLRPFPGAIKAYINDYNKDGLPDIWALFSQGEEGVFLFTNKGNGRFSEKEVLRFPPVYGSSYFELVDFNKDGSPDIVYTCGDNADYSTVLKPYHGVYIFINDGNNNFKQQYFFPINGCYKALPRDFDGDGDLDLATISFFANYTRQPEEGFVYLENKGDYRFQPYSHPATTVGRWLTMDAGDINGDGKPDIILGNFSVAPAMKQSKTDWKKGPPFIVLQNVSKVH